MNIREYISSGILEAYALGELNDVERTEVENNLKRYPELRQELQLIEEAQEKFMMQTAIAPRAAVKEKVMRSLDQNRTEGKVVSLNFWKMAAAASVTLAIIASYLALNYHSKWKESESQRIALTQERQRTAEAYNQVNQRIDKLENDVKVMNNPDFKRVMMMETPNAPGALASVYWNEKSSEVYLNILNMKTLARENQYQLWAIIDGKPVDAGVFDANVAGLIKMKDVTKGATTFAVTIEPRGGKSSPTLETMQVAGNVIKG